MKPTPIRPISYKLLQIIDATEALLSGEPTVVAGQELLKRREYWVASALSLRDQGAAWGPEEEALLVRLRELDDALLKRLRAPLRDAFEWMHGREAARNRADKRAEAANVGLDRSA